VDDVGFRRLVEHRYTLPSRCYCSYVALPELHSIVETHIHELLAMGVTAISFKTDIWTSDVRRHSGSTRISYWRKPCCMLENVLVLIPLLPFQWHLRTCLKLGNMNTPSSIWTTDWRNKRNYVCSWHGTLSWLLNRNAIRDRRINLGKYSTTGCEQVIRWHSLSLARRKQTQWQCAPRTRGHGQTELELHCLTCMMKSRLRMKQMNNETAQQAS
jgi:hypothetical protein